jgi:DNA-binding beta-propeller fold protein YncE
MKRALELFVACLVLLVPAGCARVHPAAESDKASALVWPLAPDTPRVMHVQNVLRPSDFGIKNSAFSRFGRWLAGSEKGNEPLVKPFGVALDENDNLCLTDTGANAVCYYDRQNKKWHRWEKVGQLQFVSPVAVAKRKDRFYVADSGLRSVVSFDSKTAQALQFTNHLGRPAGLAIGGENLFVADAERHCVVVFDLQGKFEREFGRRGTGPGDFNFPTHVSVSRDELFVTDSMNNRVQVLDLDGHFKSQFGTIGDSPGNFSRPKGIAVDSFGHVYALDALFDNVQIFDRARHLLLNFGGSGNKPGEFWLPNGIAIGRDNQIFITDSYNRRIQVLKYVGLE